MQFVTLLLVILSLSLSTFAFDVARKVNPETSAVARPEVSEYPEIPEGTKLQEFVMMDIEIEEEDADNRDETIQRIKCVPSQCNQICRVLGKKCGYCKNSSTCVCLG
ncbi:unnamed protein product [Hermetia illucens]|uniref:Uncharacterized protein n=1 Tax=Hermetia illucens TaxID=343691 RepID=A0A7R8YXT5_HERIL|nr:uncharacterized protein LOC119654436 [Hermetia illucens]CAD7089328.1 unnamed protein product [Hermetia illucens]